MAHSVIDMAHISAEQNRINNFITRLQEQWIEPEPDEKGNDLDPFHRS
jgi:hypothetical protein